jgi:hypothetical protein
MEPVIGEDIALDGEVNCRPVAVCTENRVRIDLMTESPNVIGDDRAAILLIGAVHLAIQFEEPACGRECRTSASLAVLRRKVRGRVQLTSGDRFLSSCIDGFRRS